ncbi:MAG: hypothetical protein JW837_13300 [Sedimentisphaerales bacterium]|nr:hypothetical protein [Sedimentisphaerales bacterium]
MEEERIKCPYCSELIMVGAKKCRFCGEWFKDKNKPDVNNTGIFQLLRETSEKPPEPKAQREIEEPIFDLSDNNIKKPGVIPLDRKPKIYGFRLVLTIAYIGVIVGFVFYERSAHKVLHSGQAEEQLAKFQDAGEKYIQVIKEYRLSFAVIEAQKSLERVQARLESKVNIYSVYWLPFVSWPVCSVLLFLIFVTRIHRAGIAFLAFVLLLLGIFGSVIQLSWYGLISIEPLVGVIQHFKKEPTGIFIASYLLVIVTAIMALTSTRKFPFGYHILEAKRNGR